MIRVKRWAALGWADRLRASELSAKADGDFAEDKTRGTQLVTYRELLMTRAGAVVEVDPPHKLSMADADLAEEIIVEDNTPTYALEGFFDAD